MSQTVVQEQAIAFEGMKADSGFDDVVSRIAEEDIPFGKLVVIGTDKDRQCLLPAAELDVTTANLVLGVAIQDHARPSQVSGAARYLDEEMVSIMHKGRIYVKVEEAVEADSDVFVRYAAGGNGLGSFRASAGTSEAAALAGARYLKAAGAGEFAVVELDL